LLLQAFINKGVTNNVYFSNMQMSEEISSAS